MSKLLKRTFAFALVFCILLSVIPAVSADDPVEPTVYTYTFTSANQADSTAANDATTPYWYRLAGSNSMGKFDSEFAINATNNSNWAAIVINVPEAGTYDFAFDYRTWDFSPVEGFYFLKVDDAMEQKIVAVAGGTGKTYDDSATVNIYGIGTYVKAAQHKVEIDQSYGRQAYNVWTMGGAATLEAGHYAMIVRGVTKGTNNYFYAKLTSLRLTKGDSAASLNYCLEEATKDGDLFVQLAANYNIPDATVSIPRNVHLNLNGYTLTADTVIGGSVTDTTAHAGSLVCNSAPTLINDNGYYYLVETYSTTSYPLQLPMYDAESGAYKFVAPTVTLADALQTPKDSANDKAIVFNVTLPDAAAYGYVDEEIEIELTLTVGENSNTYRYSITPDAENPNQITAWAENAGTEDKLFYADLSNLDAIVGETLTVTAQIRWNNVVASSTVDYAIEG